MAKPVLDAAQSVFFSRELETIETKLYEVKYPNLEAEMLLPNRTQVPDGDDKYTFRVFDKRASAVPFAGHENGAPLADVDGEEETFPITHWAQAYGFNVMEIAAAARAGRPLTDMRAMAARRALAEKLNSTALQGYSPKNIKGLFNMSNTLTATVAAGVGGSTWALKTADEILIDLFQMADTIPNSTVDIENPTRLVLPKSSIRLISSKRMSGSSSDRTVLEFFKIQRPGLDIMGANYLDTAGAGGTKRALVYNPADVSWLVSVPFEQMPVEQQGFRFVVNMRASGGGVVTPYPKSVLYVDGF